MKIHPIIINIVLLVLLFSSLAYLAYGDWQDHDMRFKCGVVYDTPYDYKIDDVPEENYIVIDMKWPLPDYRWISRAEKELNLKLAKISNQERNERMYRFMSLKSGKIKPLLANEGMKLGDDVLIIEEVDYEPPLLLVGVYNPTPRKICVLKEVLNSFRSEEYYNYKYIFYRMLTPLSMDNRIQEIMESIPWDKLEARARSIFGVSDKEAWEIGIHYLNKSYIEGGGEGILGGIEIFVLIPNPSRDKVHEWVEEVRKYIPKDMPIIFEFTEKRYIVGENDIGVTPIKNNVAESSIEEDANEEHNDNYRLFYLLVIVITGLIAVSIFIITRYIGRNISI